MATVKITCPQCLGHGLIGDAFPNRCPQCAGTGTISQDDTMTLAALNTTAAAGANSVGIVKTSAPIAPNAAVRTASKGK